MRKSYSFDSAYSAQVDAECAQRLRAYMAYKHLMKTLKEPHVLRYAHDVLDEDLLLRIRTLVDRYPEEDIGAQIRLRITQFLDDYEARE